MAVFVLVHGAWGGAHGFRNVRGPLREAGHEVFTPSLPPLAREHDDPAEVAWYAARRRRILLELA